MHRRNPYRTAPNFDALARSYPPLAKYVKGRSIDFHDDTAQRCLTQALLQRDFGLDMVLPPDRLCPPVPNRLNYVLWIQDIVAAHTDAFSFIMGNGCSSNGDDEKKVAVLGLDIGTGASAIYPLLACKLEPEWNFIATELDTESYHYALTNVHRNGLADRIRVIKVNGAQSEYLGDPDIDHSLSLDSTDDPESSLTFGFDRLFRNTTPSEDENIDGMRENSIPSGKIEIDRITDAGMESEVEVEIQFTMCNPPFYSSAADVSRSEAGKEGSASGVCTGAPIEMITPGGEVRFVCAMVRESAGVGESDGNERQISRCGETSGWGEDILHTRTEEGTGIGSKRRRSGDDDSGTACKSTDVPVIAIDTRAQDMIITEKRDSGSKKNRRKVLRSQWYTSMLGKLSSVVEVVDAIKEVGIANYAITEFIQGQTRRWAVGWSFGPWRLDDDTSRITNPNPNQTLQRLMPPKNTLWLILPNVEGGADTAVERRVEEWDSALREVLACIEGVIVVVSGHQRSGESRDDNGEDFGGWDTEHPIVVGSKFVIGAMHDTWSRSARRKRMKVMGNDDKSIHDGLDPVFGMVCTAVIVVRGRKSKIVFRWVYGWERGLFESFTSHVVRRVSVGSR